MNKWWYCSLIQGQDGKVYMLKQTDKGWEMGHEVKELIEYSTEVVS